MAFFGSSMASNILMGTCAAPPRIFPNSTLIFFLRTSKKFKYNLAQMILRRMWIRLGRCDIDLAKANSPKARMESMAKMIPVKTSVASEICPHNFASIRCFDGASDILHTLGPRIKLMMALTMLFPNFKTSFTFEFVSGVDVEEAMMTSTSDMTHVVDIISLIKMGVSMSEMGFISFDKVLLLPTGLAVNHHGVGVICIAEFPTLLDLESDILTRGIGPVHMSMSEE
mmetsp:Transcript_18024/g.25474  ORF Transcript_18024/g.25474 Transcript_18024/m.25474 type:complete len:227 (-) Transcript_18024:1170-1850(-)